MISARREQLIAACKRFDVARLDVFGSAARGHDFNPARSDVDLLVDFGGDGATDAYLDLEEALQTILGRKVDLVDRRAIETSRNFIRRRSILDQAEPIYVA